MNIRNSQRNTNQEILPQKLDEQKFPNQRYNLYPFHDLQKGRIHTGYDTLADWIVDYPVVKIDGYVGVDWGHVQTSLAKILGERSIRVNWIVMDNLFKPTDVLEDLIKPYLGPEGSVWGKNTELSLDDFFEKEQLQAIQIDSTYQINIIIGVGAELVPVDASLVYFDLPKNELLYRMRGKSITNLGATATTDNTTMYKRFYFVDWVVLNKHKQSLVDRVALFVDSQWTTTVSWALAEDIFATMQVMARSVFRPRPWFDPGVWGGQWMKEHFSAAADSEENLAWSFEIIAPENGLVFQCGDILLELSFDIFMYREYTAVLGKHAAEYGCYFPIRFDFLDTFDGGNLSIQCHPTRSYIQENFGETYTQDETYYIMDTKPGAGVYLGFQQDIDPHTFQVELVDSLETGKPIDIERYVQRFPSTKHDLFLIPNGTIHSSGKDNLVLEISATPYIFTFKMYDWLQKDSSGKPRPINIEHAYKNLNFDRKGAHVARELISRPELIEQGKDWRVVHLPTHRDHYYDVHRLEFTSSITIQTNDACHILMLVEGVKIQVVTNDGRSVEFNYAETFIIPAAADTYRIVNKTNAPVKVIKAFLKPNSTDVNVGEMLSTNQGGDGKD